MSDEQAKQFLEQATQSLQSGQFQQALDLAEQAIALKENDESQILKGIALSQLNQPDGATTAFRRAITLNAYNPKAYYNLAVHYYAQGQRNEALEMARETVRIDSKHAGARDLVARIDAELTPKTDVAAPRIMDDGTTTTAGPETPPSEGIGPQAPYQGPPTGGYTRPGYETSGVHSLQFVERMGKTWDTFAWILIVILAIACIFYWVTNIGQFMEAFGNPEAMRRLGGMNAFSNMSIFQLVVAIIGFLARIAALVWMIMELSDRRGNWLWLLPYLLCCCCAGADWLVMGIYLLAGRQK